MSVCGTSVNSNIITYATIWGCGSPITDSRDNKTYSTVLIGTQCWMAQNLNVGTRINGSVNQTDNSNLEKYCYDDLESNCDIYGGLYQWNEAMQYVTTEGTKGICLTGWHLPMDAEWTTLTTFLGGVSVARGKMKEVGTTHWASPNTGATNSSGVTAFAGGDRDYNGYFTNLTGHAYFWSSMQYNASDAWYRGLYHGDETLDRSNYTKINGWSARCLKD